MTAREIADLFFQLELTLIASLKRNLARHKAWEKEEGFDWEAWQSAKLRDIRRFQKENRKEVEKLASVIDQETRQLIEEQYQEGGAEGFFSMNDRRVNALLDEMQTAQQQVEKAALRYMDDVYRKTIRTAALGMATGSMTLQQATDAATKDFLAAGINCVQYKNGRRVNIASYAEMALRTAATRATLMGEAKLRESMDIDTVLVSQYGACSETCLPWQGLVYIDDVWQDYDGPHTPGGTYGVSRNGHQYPLLSVAVKNGLFHPNCRHTLTTWFEGISTRPEPMDKAKIERTSRLEKQQRAMERNVRELKRLAAGTQDDARAAAYRKEARTAQKKLKAFVDENGDALRRDYWRERYDGVPLQRKQVETCFNLAAKKNSEKEGQYFHKVNKDPNLPRENFLPKGIDVTAVKVDGYKNVYVSDKAIIKPKELHDINKNTEQALKSLGISKEKKPKIVIVSNEELPNAYGKYIAYQDTVYYTAGIDAAGGIDEAGGFGAIEYHEMCHLKQAEAYRSKGKIITKENFHMYLQELRDHCKIMLDNLGVNEYNVSQISEYARRMYSSMSAQYDEVEAEYRVFLWKGGKLK